LGLSLRIASPQLREHILGNITKATREELEEELKGPPQAVSKVQALAVEDERLLLGLVRVQRGDEARLAKEEIQVLNPVEVALEGFVGVNSEVGGNNRKPRAGPQLGFEKISDVATSVVVPDARVCRGCWHFTDFSHKPCRVKLCHAVGTRKRRIASRGDSVKGFTSRGKPRKRLPSHVESIVSRGGGQRKAKF